MRRREFITLIGVAAALPMSAMAQQSDRVRRIGVLIANAETAPEGLPRIAALRDGLQQFGWIQGRNIHLEFRWVPQLDRIQDSAKALVALAPQLIGGKRDPATAAFRREPQIIPILFVSVGDPIGGGFIESLSRP